MSNSSCFLLRIVKARWHENLFFPFYELKSKLLDSSSRYWLVSSYFRKIDVRTGTRILDYKPVGDYVRSLQWRHKARIIYNHIDIPWKTEHWRKRSILHKNHNVTIMTSWGVTWRHWEHVQSIAHGGNFYAIHTGTIISFVKLTISRWNKWRLRLHTLYIGGIFITGIFGDFYTKQGFIFVFQNGNSRWPSAVSRNLFWMIAPGSRLIIHFRVTYDDLNILGAYLLTRK